MNYYTYAYLRDDGSPYYIGKGKNKRAWTKHGNISVPKDKKRIIILKKNLTECEAFKHEKYMIYIFGRKDNNTGILRNKTDGGEGGSGSVRPDLSEYNKRHKRGSNLSNEHIEKVRYAMLERGSMPHMTENGRKNMKTLKLREINDLEFAKKMQKIRSDNGKQVGKITGKLNKGRKHSSAVNARKGSPGIKNGMYNKIRCTNGLINIQINSDQEIPQGFWRGITRRNKP